MSPLIGRQANGRVRGWFRRSPGRHGSSAQCQDRDRCVLADAGPDAVAFSYTFVQANVTGFVCGKSDSLQRSARVVYGRRPHRRHPPPSATINKTDREGVVCSKKAGSPDLDWRKTRRSWRLKTPEEQRADLLEMILRNNPELTPEEAQVLVDSIF